MNTNHVLEYMEFLYRSEPAYSYMDEDEIHPWCTPPDFRVVTFDEDIVQVEMYSSGCGRGCCNLDKRVVTLALSEIESWMIDTGRSVV